MSNSKATEPIRTIFGVRFERIPVKTRILSSADSISDIVREFALPLMQPGDILCISESPLAITQGRAIPVSQIKVSPLARLLSHYVVKVPYGIVLGAPTSMQCAIEETGIIRILFAAFVGAIGKLIGRKGDFYRIAGMQAALVDAATTSPVPPYNETVIKEPQNPKQVCDELNAEFGFGFAVMDINDIGGSWMIGGSQGGNKHFIETGMNANPQGQGSELTPLCIVRRMDK
jgi:F420-0:gamma-glutamyl ligase-like protein